jgi:hypothetical protein
VTDYGSEEENESLEIDSKKKPERILGDTNFGFDK